MGLESIIGKVTDILGPLTKATTSGGGFQEIPLSDDQKIASKYLADLLGRTSPLQGFSDLTDTEKAAGIRIEDILNKGVPGYDTAYSLAKETATEPYDIMQLPEVQGLMKSITEAGQLEGNRLMRGFQKRGSNSSSKGRDILGRNVTDMQQKLASSISPFIENERARRFAAIPLLAQLGEQGTTLPLNLALSYGSLSRDVADKKLAAKYEQELFPFNTQAGIASNIMGQQRFAYQEPILSPSILMQLATAAGGVGAASPF